MLSSESDIPMLDIWTQTSQGNVIILIEINGFVVVIKRNYVLSRIP